MSSNEGSAPLGSSAGQSEGTEDADPVGHKALHQMIARGASFSGAERNCAYLNLGEGAFAHLSVGSGIDLADDARAVLRVDWDRDGDLDLWTTNRSGPQLRFFRNVAGDASDDWIALRLAGVSANARGIGARVELRTDQGALLVRHVSAGDGFLSQSSSDLVLRLGGAGIESLLVHWPGGERESFSGAQLGASWILSQGSGAAQAWERPSPAPVLPAKPIERRAPQDAGATFLTRPLALPPLAWHAGDPKSGAKAAESQRLTRGKPTLVSLWASWCAPCLVELKHWGEDAARFRQAGISVVPLSTDQLGVPGDPAAAARLADKLELAEHFDAPAPLAFAAGETLGVLQAALDHLFMRQVPLALPASVLLDAEGRLCAVYRGPVSVERVLADAARLDASPVERRAASVVFPGRWVSAPGTVPEHDFARVLADDGYLQGAAEMLFSAARPAPGGERAFARAATDIGNRMLIQGHAEGAQELYRLALDLRPKFAKAWYNLGLALEYSKDQKGALKAYDRALELREGYWQARFNRALIYASTKRGAESRADLERVTQEAPDLAQGFYQLSLRVFEDGDPPAAQVLMQQALVAAEAADDRFWITNIKSRLKAWSGQ
ncbi:MAG: tetratricopeptide (TPR) repeat protein [Planctomycetota bacterium]